MGPFSSNSFLVKTIAYGRSRPTTPTSIQIPFNLLSRSIQVMRQSGITVTAITNIHEVGNKNQSDTKKPASSEPKRTKREMQSDSANETEVKKEKKTTNRRARKKS
ncbi:MAG: hypothetical protein QNK79_06900 [Synechococcus sp. ArSW.bin.68]|jgi:hypothetical protein